MRLPSYYSLSLLLLTPFLASTACKPDAAGEPIEREQLAQQVAQVVCEAYASCACDSVAVGNAAECSTALQPALERAIVDGELYGLRYFPQCLDKTEVLLSAFGCNQTTDPDDPALAEAVFESGICKLLAGDAGRGDPCTSVGSLGFSGVGDTCKHELVCAGGICVDWPDKEGDICEDIGVCPPGLGCIDPEADGVHTCEVPSGAGGACNPHDFGAGCTADLFCSPVSTSCEALPGTGQACLDGICASGHFCLADICTVPPGANQPCPDGVCAEGLACDFATGMPVCIALPAEGEMCLNGSGCAAGLVCDFDVCVQPPAAVCSVPESIGLCIYPADGICDEPEGTGLCQEATDPQDCGCPTELNGVCDEPEGTGACNEGTDTADCENFCPTQNNGACDEPEGGNTCVEGSDPFDCGATTCPVELQGDGFCDEPEGSAQCPEGTDPIDCGAAMCPAEYQGDGFCDEPEGSNLCPEGTDPIDCAAPACTSQGDGICDEPEGTGVCAEGTDPADCDGSAKCPFAGDGECDEPEGTNLCAEGTDPLDCF